MKNFLFITTTNLSTNPRLLKELKLAQTNDFECTFIGFKLGNWSDKTEKEQLKALNCKQVHYISAIQKPFFIWVFSTMVWKLSNLFSKYFKNNLKVNAFAHNKRSWQIVRKLSKLKNEYDLIIAHNLGALYPAYQFSQKHEISFAFDIEDYHPGEKSSSVEKQRREFLMQKLLPNAAYVSYASPLIGEQSLQLISEPGIAGSRKFESFKYLATGAKCNSRAVCDTNTLNQSLDKKEIKLPESLLINNSFSQSEFYLKENQSEKVKFVWFSQNITWGRGLEQIIPALAKFQEKIELYLIGNKRQDFYNEILKKYDGFINYIEPLPLKVLNLKLSEFDIGLAIEISGIDLNKDIALSNKIFAYAQSGLYILATDTSAQKQFVEEHNSAPKSDFDFAQSPNSWPLSEVEMTSNQSSNRIGLLSGQSTEEMEKAVSVIIDEVETIRANKKLRFEYTKQLAWENEGKKLLNVWEQLL